jgi:hypothetical protein
MVCPRHIHAGQMNTMLLPPFLNIRCFKFMKEMYLDIF